jgi:hypothetical protein
MQQLMIQTQGLEAQATGLQSDSRDDRKVIAIEEDQDKDPGCTKASLYTVKC